MSASISAIIPVKRFEHAKQRLAPIMNPDERVRLVSTMLDDVLNALGEIAGLELVVVTGDGKAAAIAIGFGAKVIDDPCEAGTNAAVKRAMKSLSADGLLVVPGDVPDLRAADLRRVLPLMDGRSVAIVPAVRDGGTNLLACMPAGVIGPCFGVDSFARHVAAAWQAGIEPHLVNLDSAGIDIDRPDDVAAFLARPPRTRTHALLGELGMAARIEAMRPQTEPLSRTQAEP